MNVRPLISLFFAGAMVAAVACGSSQPEPTNPTGEPAASSSAPPPAASTTEPAVSSAPAASASAPTEPAAAPATWAEAKTKEQQAAFMKAHIVPAMSKVFQAQDSKRYAEFGCVTCHGPKYQVPKDFLPKLTMANGKFAATADKAAIMKFMGEKVVPAMADAMGEKPFDVTTKTGFGCGGCHTIEMK